MTEDMIAQLMKKIIPKIPFPPYFEIEASGRHVHLDRKTIDGLFGEGYELKKARALSQPNQYACQERISLVGPEGVLHNVVVLGPERKQTQVEVSLTDARKLGLKVPVRASSDLRGSPGILLLNKQKSFQLEEGLIVAQRHIHLSEADARLAEVEHGQLVRVKVFSERPLIFADVLIRVSNQFSTVMHIDYDEANACGFFSGVRGRILKKEQSDE